MKATVREDHAAEVRRVVEPMLAGETASPRELADEAGYSRFHFHRIFTRLMGETPGDMRRRLLLERAAWLIRQGTSATEAAFEVGFGSLEGFSKAFRRSFGVLPSAYGAAGKPLWLPCPNGVHFSPVASLPQGGNAMDLIDRLLDHDLALTRQIFDLAGTLSDEQLDSALPAPVQAICYEEPQNSIRDVLEMIVFTKEVWIAAVEHQAFPEKRERSLEVLRQRAEAALAMFAGLVRRVRDAGEWDTEFVDELCEEPTPFTFGGMIAHVLATTDYRRGVLVAALRAQGCVVTIADPLEWEQAARAPR